MNKLATLDAAKLEHRRAVQSLTGASVRIKTVLLRTRTSGEHISHFTAKGFCMETVLSSVLAAILICCTPGLMGPVPVEADESAVSRLIVARPEINPRAPAFKGDRMAKKAKSKPTIAVKMETPPSTQPANETDPPLNKLSSTNKAESTIRPKMKASASTLLADETDPVLKKAKATIAAKMEDPSAEFSEMKRAVRKNTLGRPVDTICGYVKGKSASGETGERPFLYLVLEDEVFIVDRSRDMIAATAYRNICN
jgi:hypothetical protein